MVEEKWKKMKNRGDFMWECASAKKEHRKGRVKGGIIIAVKKSLKVIKINEVSNEIMEIKLEYNGNRWRIVTLYSQKIEETIESEQIKKEEEDYLLVGRDFNARTRSEGGLIKEEKKEEREEIRRSIDKVVNKDTHTDKQNKRKRMGNPEWELRKRGRMDLYRRGRVIGYRLYSRK